MKLIEQYLEAVGRHLPFGGREDVKKELRSLLLDDLEARFGAEPTEDQVKGALKAFGAPAAVAKRYGGNRDVIAPGLAPLYYLLLKIVLGALAVAFFVLFVLSVVDAIVGPDAGAAVDAAFVLAGLGRFAANTVSAYLGAVGAVTLIFAAVSRRSGGAILDPDADWSPDELADIEVGPEPVSRVGTVVSVAVLVALAALLNLFPQALTLAEDLFARGTRLLGHRVDIARFLPYARILALVWSVEIASRCVRLAANGATRVSANLDRLAYVASPLVLGLLLADPAVYSGGGVNGFRLVFAVFFFISVAELCGLVYREAKAFLARRAA